MSADPSDLARRTVLQLTAGLAAGGSAAFGTASAADAAKAGDAARAAPAPAPTGKPGDFDFLSGRWTIQHRRLKEGAWDVFDGEATVHGLLDGVASVEELRIPARNFSGMGLRLLDVERKLWADFWVNRTSGVLTPPPAWGGFVDGVGLWDSDDDDNGTPIVVRGAWDQITPRSCRWYQAVSRDQGRSWQENWVMHWTRV